MENLIKLSLKGGYEINGLELHDDNMFAFRKMESLSELFIKCILDLNFWESLGNACKWKENYFCSLCNSLSQDGCDETCAYFKGKEPQYKWAYLKFMRINFEEGFQKAVDWLNEETKNMISLIWLLYFIQLKQAVIKVHDPLEFIRHYKSR